MIEINYEGLLKETINFINQNKLMVLATCSGNRVTARMVSIINDVLTIYCQTDRYFLKVRQVKANPNVALAIGNIQIEGAAQITCHPLQSPFFIEQYQKHHQSAFNRYSALEDNVIIEIYPRLVTFWKYDAEHQPFRDFLDIGNKKAYREYYRKPIE